MYPYATNRTKNVFCRNFRPFFDNKLCRFRGLLLLRPKFLQPRHPNRDRLGQKARDLGPGQADNRPVARGGGQPDCHGQRPDFPRPRPFEQAPGRQGNFQRGNNYRPGFYEPVLQQQDRRRKRIPAFSNRDCPVRRCFKNHRPFQGHTRPDGQRRDNFCAIPGILLFQTSGNQGFPAFRRRQRRQGQS